MKNVAIKIGPILLLMLIARCHCAKLFNFGGTAGYDSHINGTIGTHTKIDRNGMSINGTSEVPVGVSWNSTLGGKGYAGVGDKIIGADATLKTDINNFARKRVQVEIGRNSNGTYVLEHQNDLQLDNTLSVSPQFQAATGDDARELVGLQKPVPKIGTEYNPSMNNLYSYGVNPYANNQYVVNPYAGNPYVVNPYVVNPYAGNPYAVNPSVLKPNEVNSYSVYPYKTNYNMANSYTGPIPNGPSIPNGYMPNPYVSYVPINNNGVPMNTYMGFPNNYMPVGQSQLANMPFLENPNYQDQRQIKG